MSDLEKEKYVEYFDILKALYREQDISIEWFKHNFRLVSKVNLEDHLKSFGEHLNLDEFEIVISEIVTLIREIATGNQLDDFDDWKVLLVRKNLVTDEELSHINILSTSNVDTIYNINHEILTKRRQDNINEAIGYSLLLTLESRESNRNTVSYELSKKQLQQLIKDLEKCLSNIKNLEKDL